MISVPRVRDTLETHQIPVYLLAVAAGFAIAFTVPDATGFEDAINPALALMLFATFLQLPVASMRRAIGHGRFIAALLVANFIAVPLLVALAFPLLPGDPLIRIGVLFVLLCPCIDYVVTFSQLGKADASLLLAATPILLGLQLLLLPLYLALFMGAEATGLVEPGPFLHAFAWLIVVPFALAATLQAAAKRSPIAARATTWAGLLPVPATALVLTVVIAAVVPQLGLALPAASSVLPVYVAFALVAPLAGIAIARGFGLVAPATRAIAFSTGTRNSLVVLPLALAIPGALPVVPAVVVTQTLVELLAMLAYIKLIPRIVPSRRQA
ncbi:MAG: arsenic resistance protein [Luteimonas sp.]|nr:arsenic resistance protein [Luteimonas sp.]